MRYSWLYKWLLPIVGTVALGAIGSGVWEAVFKPGLSWITIALLDVATLGIDRLRDDIYLEIAKGTYERASLKSETVLVAVMLCFSVVTCTRFIQLALRNDDANVKSKIHRKNAIFVGWVLCLVLGVIAGIIQISLIRDIYIVRAANNIEQFQKVVAPAISENERISIASRVAQIGSRADYEKIINELSATAKNRGLRIPKFDIY
jgi:hypothetical protein